MPWQTAHTFPMIRFKRFAARRPGPILVFLHGWGSDSRIWDTLRESLPGEHWLLDLPGHGSADACSEGSRDDYIAELAQALPQRCVLLGWSLGGMVATCLAGRYPDKIAGLITLAANAVFVQCDDWPEAMPAATYQQFSQSFATRPEATYQRFLGLQSQGDRHRKALSQRLRTHSSEHSVSLHNLGPGLAWLAQIDNRAALATLPMPHLHILGEADALVPATAGERLSGFERATVQVVDGAGHVLPWCDQPGMRSWILGWLEAQGLVGIAVESVAGSFARAAPGYQASARVQADIVKSLLEGFPVVNDGERVMDLGCGTGYVSQFLLEADICVGQMLLVDLALPMLESAREFLQESIPGAGWLAADAEQLPLADGCMDRVISSLMLQWCFRSDQVLREVARVLAPGGTLLLATLGPDTLHELKSAWRTLDSYMHVNRFQSVSDLVYDVEAAGLTVRQVTQRQHVMRYTAVMPLLRDLKSIGAHNMNRGRQPGLTGRGYFQKLEQAYGAFREPDGLLPATYDVIYLLAEKHHG